MQDSVLLCTLEIQIAWKQNRALYFRKLDFELDPYYSLVTASERHFLIKEAHVSLSSFAVVWNVQVGQAPHQTLSQLHEVAWHVSWHEMLHIQSSISEYEKNTHKVLLNLISGIIFQDKTGFLGQGRLGGAAAPAGEWLWVSDGCRQAAGGRFRQQDRTPFFWLTEPHSSLGLRSLRKKEYVLWPETAPSGTSAAGPASRNMHNGREICQCEFDELPSYLQGSKPIPN